MISWNKHLFFYLWISPSLYSCDVMQTSILCWTNSRTLKCAQCNWMVFCSIQQTTCANVMWMLSISSCCKSWRVLCSAIKMNESLLLLEDREWLMFIWFILCYVCLNSAFSFSVSLCIVYNDSQCSSQQNIEMHVLICSHKSPSETICS